MSGIEDMVGTTSTRGTRATGMVRDLADDIVIEEDAGARTTTRAPRSSSRGDT